MLTAQVAGLIGGSNMQLANIDMLLDILYEMAELNQIDRRHTHTVQRKRCMAVRRAV